MITTGAGSISTESELDSETRWPDWLRSLRPPGPGASASAYTTWLAQVQETLRQRADASREMSASLAGRWQQMRANLNSASGAEVGRTVDGLIRSAEHLAAAEALGALVQMERDFFAQLELSTSGREIQEERVRQLLDTMAIDRSAMTSSLISSLLETLCNVALDLEVTQRHLERDPDRAASALDDLHGHINAAAAGLRSMPSSVDVTFDRDEPVATALRRCVEAYDAALDCGLHTVGPGVVVPEIGAALVWSLQEMLHHLRTVASRRVRVVLTTESRSATMTVSTPTSALRPEPSASWFVRCQLRIDLAGGTIETRSDDSGSAVTVHMESL